MSNRRAFCFCTGRILQRYSLGFVAATAAILNLTPAGATTLNEALTQAWSSNPGLQAQRARLGVATENVKAAKGGYYPQVQLVGGIGTTHQDVTSSFFPVSTIVLNSRSVGLAVEQPLYAGGKIDASVMAATHLLSAQQAQLHAIEERVLLDATRAYLDVQESQAVLRLEQNNVRLLQQALDAARASFQNGEVTHTDVDQAQARLAGAQAGVIQAQGALASAQADYTRIIGLPPDDLAPPASLTGLPASEREAEQLALRNYPVVAAQFAAAAAQSDVDYAEGSLKPSVTLSGQVSAAREPAFPFEKYDQRSIMLQFSMPLYQGGALRSQVRAARHQADSREQDALDAQRTARDHAVRAWQAYQTAKSGLAAIDVQIVAAQSAYDGVQAEYREGERTTLDVLNAEQELLGAQVNHVRARHDEIAAEYALKAATGQLTAAALHLPVRPVATGQAQ